MVNSSDKAVIYNAMVEVFGYDESLPLRAAVESSPRYASLLAMAGNGLQWDRLKKALQKVAKNPKTRAAF
jgi:hypothetical protein